MNTPSQLLSTPPSRRGALILPLLSALLLCSPHNLRAGFHDRGNTVFSLGGSISHTSYKDRTVVADTDYILDIPWLTDEEQADLTVDTETSASPPDSGNYRGMDLSIFLTTGYFVIDGTEVGISGSTMVTLYSGGGPSDLYIYDAELYTKHFFDNDTSVTPYVGAKGGVSWLDIGGYQELNTVGGVSAGLEFSGASAFTWFIEFSSQYTINDEDLTGTEWRNRLYIGFTYYFDLLEDEEP